MKIGIIGGSGLDDPNILDAPSDVEIDTRDAAYLFRREMERQFPKPEIF